MHVLVVTAGSWGDVLFFVPPALELQRRGHEVTVAVPPIFRISCRRMGLERVLSAGPFVRRDRLTAFHRSVGVEPTGRALFAHYWKWLLLPDVAQVVSDLAATPARFDVILSHYHSVAGYAFANLTGVPRVTLTCSPACIPSNRYPPPGVALAAAGFKPPLLSRSPNANSVAWRDEMSWATTELGDATNEVLAQVGVGPVVAPPYSLPLLAERTLVSSYPGLLARPADWSPTVTQVGYPYTDGVPGTVNRDLEEFLASGSAPVLVTFGTAVARGLPGLYELAIDVLQELGHRVLVLGYSPSTRSARVAAAEFVPLSSVVDRCAFAIHHGGPGTTDVVLRAGLPAVVVPQFLDQPLTGAMVADLGAAKLIHPSEVTRGSLAGAIRRIADGPARRAAVKAATHLGSPSDGAKQVADVLEGAA